MKYKVLDIETTGLALSDEIVSFTFGTTQRIRSNSKSEQALLKDLSILVSESKKDILLTFNGLPKYGQMSGFDIPILRTRYIKNNMIDKYPFSGMQHIDVSEMAKKALNTRTYSIPSPDDLSAEQVMHLMHLIEMHPAKTKKDNIRMINDIKKKKTIQTINTYVAKNTEQKATEHNSLDSICLNVFNNWDEEMIDEIKGNDVPEVWDLYLKTGGTVYLDKILKHNQMDARKTALLFKSLEKITSYRPVSIL